MLKQVAAFLGLMLLAGTGLVAGCGAASPSGGVLFVLEADTEKLTRSALADMEAAVRRELRRGSIGTADFSMSEGQLSFAVRDPAQVGAALEIANGLAREADSSAAARWEVEAIEGNRVVLRQTQAAAAAALDEAMAATRRAIERRLTAFGAARTNVARQGPNRIEVEVPGLHDPEALRPLISRTGRLEFRLVHEEATYEHLASGEAPIGSEILPYPEADQPIAVRRRAIITGDMIAGARQVFDEHAGAPVVTIHFDEAGSRRFARVTRENVGKRFAIVLDGVVLSAPHVNEPILGGTAQISGGFTVETANHLAHILRMGVLPLDVAIVEERVSTR